MKIVVHAFSGGVNNFHQYDPQLVAVQMLGEMECTLQYVTAEVTTCHKVSHTSWTVSGVRTTVAAEYQHFSLSSTALNHALHQCLYNMQSDDQH